MLLKAGQKLKLELIEDKHAQSVFNLVNANKKYLQQWLPWVAYMQSVEFIQNFIKGSQERKKEGIEFAFVIVEDENIVGRIGIYKIDNQNKIGEIGFWVAQNMQGKGIVTKSCERLITFCFNDLNLNRIEIKCGTENLNSRKIPERLNFTKEGIIRHGEFLHNKFIDLYLYSLIKNDQR